MDLTPFTVHYPYQEHWETAEIRPCCREDNVVDYAIWKDQKLAFTVTRVKNDLGHSWVIALRNADSEIDDELVQILGNEIDKNIPAGS